MRSRILYWVALEGVSSGFVSKPDKARLPCPVLDGHRSISCLQWTSVDANDEACTGMRRYHLRQFEAVDPSEHLPCPWVPKEVASQGHSNPRSSKGIAAT